MYISRQAGSKAGKRKGIDMLYSQDLIEEVRSRNDIVDVISQYVSLKRNGNRYVGLCPFHNEKTPSFYVNRQNQFFYCFGCHVGGDLFTFMKDYESMTFQEAVKYLADRAGVSLPEVPMGAEEKRKLDQADRMKDMYKEAAVFYYKALFTPAGKNGLDYFTKRGLDREAIKKYGLGYAPSGSYLYKHLRSKGYSDRELADSKLVRISEKGAFDFFWNRVMFPIFDKGGHVIAFGGRVLDDSKPKYVNSDETLIFKKSNNLYGQQIAAKSRGDTILLCEGYMDVIALQQAGFTNSVAALGTAFNLDHVLAMKRTFRGKDKVILTLDSDSAGRTSARKAINTLREGGYEDVRVLDMSPAKDPDEFIKTYGAQGYAERIEQALDSFRFEVKCKRNDFDLANPDQKTAFHHSIAEMLYPISDEMKRNNYMEAVCEQEGIELSAMRKLVNKLGEENRVKKVVTVSEDTVIRQVKKDPLDGVLRSEQMLITLMAMRPEIIDAVSAYLKEDDFSSEMGRGITALMFEKTMGGKMTPAQIMEKVAKSDEDTAAVAAYFNYNGSELNEGTDLSKVLTDAVKQIKRSSLQRQSAGCTDMAQLQKIVYEQRAVNTMVINVP